MREEEYSFVILQKENMNLREKGKMKRTIYTIKRYQKLKEPIKLRFKKLVNGNLSLYLDSYYQGCRTYLFLHLYIIPEIDDNCKRMNTETIQKALLIKNKKTMELFSTLTTELGDLKKPISRESKKEEIRLLQFVEQYANDRKKPNTEKYHGRYATIITLMRHLEHFGAKNTLLSEVDVDFVKNFIDYLHTTSDLRNLNTESKKLSESTIYLKYCILRSVLIEAQKKKLIKENPYNLLPANYKLKRPDSSRCYLTRNELSKIIQHPCKIPQLKEAFLFSCFTGLRKSDILELKWEDIIKENTKSYINKKIKKTQRWLKIPLSSQAQQWLPPRPHPAQGLVFNNLAHAALPKNLKNWLSQIKSLKKDITFHVARHTFATLELSLGASLYTVSCLLGHKSITTTQIYAKVVDKDKEQAIKLIDKKFQVTEE